MMIDGNNPDKITLYVSPYGIDSNSGNEHSPLRTINEAIKRIPKINAGERYIKLAPGEYDEKVELMRFKCGKINLSGEDNSNTKVKSLYVDECDNVDVSDIEFTESTKYNEPIHLMYSTNVSISRCVVERGIMGSVDIVKCNKVYISRCKIKSDRIASIYCKDSIIKVEYTNINSTPGDPGVHLCNSIMFESRNTYETREKYIIENSEIYN